MTRVTVILLFDTLYKVLDMGESETIVVPVPELGPPPPPYKGNVVVPGGGGGSTKVGVVLAPADVGTGTAPPAFLNNCREKHECRR